MDKSKFKNIPIVSIWNLIVLAHQRISDSPKQYTKQFSSKIKGKKRRKKQVDQRSKKKSAKTSYPWEGILKLCKDAEEKKNGK